VKVDGPVQAKHELLAQSSPVRTASEELIIKEARRRHRRRLLAIAGIVVVVIAGTLIAVISLAGHRSSPPLSTTGSTSRGPQATVAATCHAGQIAVTSLGGGAGAGNVDQVFGFVNVSKTACALTGYPRIIALDAQGSQIAQAEEQLTGIGGVHTGATTPPNVTLKPGQTGSATLSGTNIPTGGATACPPGYPAFLVTPPHTTQSVRVTAVDGVGPGVFPGCSRIRVNPIVPGTTGQLPVGPSDVPSAVSPGGTVTPTTIH